MPSIDSLSLPQFCPCGSQQSYADCCQPLIENDNARTAEQLMRSRYTAFVLQDAEYLRTTWHESTRPDDFQVGASQWLGLHIRSSTFDTVSFEAAFYTGLKAMILKECSRFIYKNEHWRYVGGDCIVETIGRNDGCFCGSGRKFKQCCKPHQGAV